jgi:hypothetical protein
MCPYYHLMESEWVHCSYVTSTRFISTNERNHGSIGLIIDIGLNIMGIVAGSPHKTSRNSMLFWPKENILYYCNLPFGIHCIPQGKILYAIIYFLEGGYSIVTDKDSSMHIIVQNRCLSYSYSRIFSFYYHYIIILEVHCDISNRV